MCFYKSIQHRYALYRILIAKVLRFLGRNHNRIRKSEAVLSILLRANRYGYIHSWFQSCQCVIHFLLRSIYLRQCIHCLRIAVPVIRLLGSIIDLCDPLRQGILIRRMNQRFTGESKTEITSHSIDRELKANHISVRRFIAAYTDRCQLIIYNIHPAGL